LAAAQGDHPSATLVQAARDMPADKAGASGDQDGAFT
jgi:hypothetical protein